ncbi:MAG: archaemetzincin [Acidobacteriota bacterium]|jgi:archaemetzincin
MRQVEADERLRSIHIVPVGKLARSVGEWLAAMVSRHVKVPCYVDDSVLVDEIRLLPGREQVDADYLLRRLEEQPVEGGAAIVGLTDADLGLPILTHVFGGARADGHTAVVSLARLRQSFYGLPRDNGLTARRAVAEVLHEVGHLAGLAHCDRYDCLMHFSPDVESIDLRGDSFCPDCAAALPADFLREVPEAGR